MDSFGHKVNRHVNTFSFVNRHGAQEVSSGDPSVAGPSSGRSYVFKGAAYRLGESEDEPVHAVPGTEGTMPQKAPQQVRDLPHLIHYQVGRKWYDSYPGFQLRRAGPPGTDVARKNNNFFFREMIFFIMKRAKTSFF